MISLPSGVSDVVRAIIDATGRDVVFETISYRDCVVCSGSDPFCTVCHGTNREAVISGFTTRAKIEWKNANRRVYRPASHDFEGSVRLTVAAVSGVADVISRSKRAIVDGYVCFIRAVYPGGVGSNRIYVLLDQDERNTRTG